MSRGIRIVLFRGCLPLREAIFVWSKVDQDILGVALDWNARFAPPLAKRECKAVPWEETLTRRKANCTKSKVRYHSRAEVQKGEWGEYIGHGLGLLPASSFRVIQHALRCQNAESPLDTRCSCNRRVDEFNLELPQDPIQRQEHVHTCTPRSLGNPV